MKIAITGASGFIGLHVRNVLAKTNHDVVIVVRNVKKIGYRVANEEIVVADFSQTRTDWFEFFGKPDAVLHLAWGGLPNYMNSLHVEVELPMQLKLLQSLIDAGLKKLVVAGTCYEYGLSSGAISESQMTNPNTPYGIAKDTLRKALFEIRSKKDFELTWARVFYPYGEGQSHQSLYSLIKAAANSMTPELMLSNSDSVLDFLPVSELSEILTVLIVNFGDVGLVNLGSGHPVSVIDFARALAKANNWSVNFREDPEPSRIFESKCFWSNNSKLTEMLLGYQTLNINLN